MTRERLNTILDALGWTQRDLAAFLGCTYSTVRGWCNGRKPVPENVAEWLDEFGGWLLANPLPKRWKPQGETQANNEGKPNR